MAILLHIVGRILGKIGPYISTSSVWERKPHEVIENYN